MGIWKGNTGLTSSLVQLMVACERPGFGTLEHIKLYVIIRHLEAAEVKHGIVIEVCR